MKFKYKLLSYAISLALGSGSGAAIAVDPKPNTKPFSLSESMHDSAVKVAGAGLGPFITVWKEFDYQYDDNSGVDNSKTYIYFRYTDKGATTGNKIKIAEFDAQSGSIGDPSVAMNPNGDAVACWSDNNFGPGTTGVVDADILCQLVPHGTSSNILTAPLTAASNNGGGIGNVSVAIDDTGDFIAAWKFYDTAAQTSQVKVKRFAANGSAKAAEIVVSQDSVNAGMAVAMDQDGDAAVAWVGKDANNREAIYARRINAAGNMTKGGFRVDSTPPDDNEGTKLTSFYPALPRIAMDDAGNFAVAWQRDRKDTTIKTKCTSYTYDGETYTDCEDISTYVDSGGVFAQRFDTNDNPLKRTKKTQVMEDMLIRYVKKKEHGSPEIAMDSTGNFVVSWQQRLYGKQCYTDDDGQKYCDNHVSLGTHIFARKYNSSKNKLTGVKTVIKKNKKSHYHLGSSVAMLDDGSFEVGWVTEQLDPEGYDDDSIATARFFKK
jgi:hypothetical protein